MREMDVNIRKAKLFMILVFSSGCLVDHITTIYGLSLPTIVELNPLVLLLINNGVWHLVEALIIVTGIYSGLTVFGLKSRTLITFSMVALVMVGLVRLYAGIHNLTLITQARRLAIDRCAH